MSSSYYIINDILDRQKDKYHPEKSKRPVASGKISKFEAIVISFSLFIISSSLAYFLSIYFLYSVLALFLFSQLYNFYVREIAFLDIILISLNFVIRAVSGAFIIHVNISYWVILLTFFISIFLVSGKRELEIKLKDINKYRACFDKNDYNTLNSLSSISVAVTIVFFSIYSILYERQGLLISLPIALYVMISYIHTKKVDPEKVRNPEKFIFDRKILFAILLWLLVVIIVLYH
jgi:4-hydroxybenzoate polyprenyltransferase